MRLTAQVFAVTGALLAGALMFNVPASASSDLDAVRPVAAITALDGDALMVSATDGQDERRSGKWTISSDGSMSAATSSAADCPAGTLCFFENANFTGWIRTYVGTQQTNFDAVANDNMTSWINRSTRYGRWFTGTVSSPGTAHCINPNSQVAQVLVAENDTASSFQINPAGITC